MHCTGFQAGFITIVSYASEFFIMLIAVAKAIDAFTHVTFVVTSSEAKQYMTTCSKQAFNPPFSCESNVQL